MDVPGQCSCLQRKCLTVSESRLAALPQAGEATWSLEEKKLVVKVKVGAPVLRSTTSGEAFCWEKGVAGSLGQFWDVAALSAAPAPLSQGKYD